MTLERSLRAFARKYKMSGKGPLSVALVITRHAKKKGLPLKSDDLLTSARGQVLGLGKSAVQSILKDHGIERVLAEEGGRTSRGSVGNMTEYVAFLNGLHEKGAVDLDAVEAWWVNRVKDFFAEKPFVLRLDTSKSLRAVIRDVLEQAERRQEEARGTTVSGTVLQHLVGAKLDLLLDSPVEHRGASVADESSQSSGDFLVADVAIHVTTRPSEALVRKCGANLDSGLKPMIITTAKGAQVAEGLAEQARIKDRLDIFEAEQFLAGNVYELGKFAQAGRRTTTEQLVEEYNRIIDKCETDPSLHIELAS